MKSLTRYLPKDTLIRNIVIVCALTFIISLIGGLMGRWAFAAIMVTGGWVYYYIAHLAQYYRTTS